MLTIFSLLYCKPVLLDRGRELQPRDRAGADADALVGDVLPVLDVLALAHDQAVVARADARDADQRLRALAERERNVLRPERGQVDVAGDQRGARVGEALKHHGFDLDVVLGRLLGQQPERRQRRHVEHALLDLERLRQRRAQVGLCERVSGGKRRNTSEHQTAYRLHDSLPDLHLPFLQ